MFTVGSLLAILGFLPGRTAAVSSRNVLFLLGFGLHLSFVGVFAFATSSERNAILKNALKIVFANHSIKGLMMEQTYTCEGHGDTVFVASHDHMVIANATTCLSDILHATLVGTLNIVAEGEEGITAQTYLGVLGNPLFLLGQGQHLGLLREELLPSTVAQYVVVLVFRDIYINGVVAVGTTDTLLERQGEHFGVLAQPPDVGLLTCQTGTVDTALLTGT